jgi:P4 family phage/plasmid primase-like protien
MEIQKNNPDKLLEITASAEEKKIEEKTKEKKPRNMESPYFYDSAHIWWVWDKKEFYWKMCDDIDVLNIYSFETGRDVVSSRRRTEILNFLKQTGRRNKPKEAPKSWIQFKDTIVDLEKGTKLNASPDYFFTNPLPYKLGESDSTPTIDKFFKEWVCCEGVQDETYIETLYEIVAYCCCQEQFLQMIIALTGSGSNGKGTFLNLISKFLGLSNVCASNLRTLATKQFEASALYKKLVCFFGEVDSNDLTNTNLIKSLTGEDLIRFEFKGKTPFTDHSSTTPIIASNSLPRTPDKSNGFYRRWLIVDFPNQFKVKRNLLAEIPEEEFENLGNKVLLVLTSLYQRNEFTNVGTIDERIDRYETRSHPLITFISEECEEGYGMIKLREFANEFNVYLKKKRLRPYTVNKIGKMLRDEGFETGSRHFDEECHDSAKAVLNISLKKKYTNGEMSSLSSSDEKLPKPLDFEIEQIDFSKINLEDKDG